jgi:asparagine synthase (glutamine-hydrolysing)
MPDPVQAVRDSVRAHLVSDVPVGIFLSAGIDSAMLAALARRDLPEQPMTFTLTFDEFRGSALDEGPGAEDIAEALGARHVERCVTRGAMEQLWPAALSAMDQPTIDGFNVYVVSHFAREVGLKVVLSGLGGDELFGSYPSFRDVPRWRSWASQLARVPGLEPVWGPLARLAVPTRPKLAGMVRFGSTLPGAYFLRRGLFLPEEIPELIDPAWAAEGLQRYDPVADAAGALGGNEDSDWVAVHKMESGLYLKNQLLRDADWASMAHSLEMRVPFVDPTLRRALAKAAFEPARSQGKAALARQAAPALREATLRRIKSGFMLPPFKFPAGAPLRWAHHARSVSLEVLRAFGVPTTAA